MSKFRVGLKSLLRQGLSELEFYGDLVYKLKKIVGTNNFSAQIIKIISHYKKICYNICVLRYTACQVINAITVGKYVLPMVSFGSKECTKALKVECAYFLGQTS